MARQITAELWSPAKQMFVAATELESDRISVWGNAFAVEAGLASAAQSSAIAGFFLRREGDIFWEGQVRQTPAPSYWDSTHTGQVGATALCGARAPACPLAVCHWHIDLGVPKDVAPCPCHLA